MINNYIYIYINNNELDTRSFDPDVFLRAIQLMDKHYVIGYDK